jgi:hypothetical protein
LPLEELGIEIRVSAMKRRSSAPNWIIGAFSILIGGIAAFAGFYGYFHGRLWAAGYDATTGQFGTGSSLYFGFLDVIFMAIGAISLKN